MLELRRHFEALSRKGRVVAAVGLLALGVALSMVLASREPVEDGRSLTQWIEKLATETPDNGEWHRAAAAVRAIGPRAVPDLVRHLEAREPRWRGPAAKLLETLHLSAPEQGALWRRSMGAAYAFGVLGPRASNAVPSIRPLLQVMPRRFAATMALAGIGEPAVPLLRDLARSTNEMVRMQVAMATRNATELGPMAVELLVQLGSDPAERVRSSAAMSLALAKADPSRVIPLLEARLSAGSAEDQAAAMNALSHYGSAAAAALPALDRLAFDGSAALGLQARAVADHIRGKAPTGH